MKRATSSGARTRARELLLQALYQKQISGHDRRELLSQFREQVAYQRVDQAYFDELLKDICESQATLEQTIDGLIDRPLDRIDIPYRVVINECVNLARRFGAIDGHKYINACLDAAAQSLREVEVRAEGSG